jgi:hypothetical protein
MHSTRRVKKMEDAIAESFGQLLLFGVASGIADRVFMSGKDAPRPYLENLIVYTRNQNKQTNKRRASLHLQNVSRVSAVVTVSVPDRSSTNAHGTSPHLSSSFATTAASSTSGCEYLQSEENHRGKSKQCVKFGGREHVQMKQVRK